MLKRVCNFLLPLCSLFIALQGTSQNIDYQNINYSQVDSWVRELDSTKYNDYPKLAYLIGEKFAEPHLRSRAIYTWLAENVAYDCKGYHNRSKAKIDATSVFKLRKGICAGYANLFKEMCDILDIECEIVTGIVLKRPKEESHAWNRIKLGSEWYLTDATWGSGFTDEKVTKFERRFSDYYFLTPPELFILNHFPDNKKMQLLKKPLSKKKFSKLPYTYCGMRKNEIKTFSPEKYYIKTEVDKKNKISFRSLNNIQNAEVVFDDGKQFFKDSLTLNKNKKGYSFEFSIQKPGIYNMTVYLNSYHTLLYAIVVKGERPETNNVKTEDIPPNKTAVKIKEFPIGH